MVALLNFRARPDWIGSHCDVIRCRFEEQKMHSSKQSSRFGTPKIKIPQKVSWQIVKTVNGRTKEAKFLLIGKRRPDFARVLRSQLIRDYQCAELSVRHLN